MNRITKHTCISLILQNSLRKNKQDERIKSSPPLANPTSSNVVMEQNDYSVQKSAIAMGVGGCITFLINLYILCVIIAR